MSGFQKCHLFSITTVRNAQKCVSQNDAITFSYVFDLPKAKKNENIALKLFMGVVSVKFCNK